MAARPTAKGGSARRDCHITGSSSRPGRAVRDEATLLALTRRSRRRAVRAARAAAPRVRARAAAAMTDRQRRFWSEIDALLRTPRRSAARAGPRCGAGRMRVARAAAAARADPACPDLHQPCEEYIDGLSARPGWEAAEFDWAAQLCASSGEIAAELDAVLGEGDGGPELVGDSVYQSEMMGAGWSAVRLQRLGVWNEEMCGAFPRTTAILRGLEPPLPFAARGVMFARQAAGTGVAPHSDARNFVLTAHLALRVPDPDAPGADCWIRVGRERRRWTPGELLVFDTSFEHETANENAAGDARDVLIVDVWHPELSRDARDALAAVYALRNRFDAGFYDAPAPAPAAGAAVAEGALGLFRKGLAEAQAALGIRP